MSFSEKLSYSEPTKDREPKAWWQIRTAAGIVAKLISRKEIGLQSISVSSREAGLQGNPQGEQRWNWLLDIDSHESLVGSSEFWRQSIQLPPQPVCQEATFSRLQSFTISLRLNLCNYRGSATTWTCSVRLDFLRSSTTRVVQASCFIFHSNALLRFGKCYDTTNSRQAKVTCWNQRSVMMGKLFLIHSLIIYLNLVSFICMYMKQKRIKEMLILQVRQIPKGLWKTLHSKRIFMYYAHKLWYKLI